MNARIVHGCPICDRTCRCADGSDELDDCTHCQAFFADDDADVGDGVPA